MRFTHINLGLYVLKVMNLIELIYVQCVRSTLIHFDVILIIYVLSHLKI